MSIDRHREAYLKGIEEFNAGQYFECHDTLEAVWSETNGQDKLFLQGLIQTSIGFYHLLNGNTKGAKSMFGKALAKLYAYKPQYGGLDVERLVQSIEQYAGQVDDPDGGMHTAIDESALPKLNIT
jgi:predicted metal-dependent hydrolase